MLRAISKYGLGLTKTAQRTLSHVPIEDTIFGLDDEAIEIRYTYRKFFEDEFPDALLRK